MKDDSIEQKASEPDSGDRLDGWKEIAAYLKRDVRTLRRWEEREELPIHRHVHEKRASVYAYRAELSAWWNNRHDRLEQTPSGRTLFCKAWRALIVSVVVITTLVLLGYRLGGRWDNQPARALQFHERDWVLVVGFENLSGEALFDETLEYALARELGESPYVNVVPRRRIEDVLRLMQRSPDTVLDSDLARELCLRDGGIKAYLSGRVEKLGPKYVISAVLAALPDGRNVASHAQQVEGPNQAWSAIQALSNWARSALGENLPQIPRVERLSRVTTPSLKALRLFSKGDILHHRGMYAAAEELYRRALAEDPDFATAHMWLAFVLKNQGLPTDEWLPHVERSVELCENTSEAERYLILAKAHYIQEDLEEARRYYEALLEIDPESTVGDWGLYGFLEVYVKTGRAVQAVEIMCRAVSGRPNDFVTHFRAVRLVGTYGDLRQAESFALRARELISPEMRQQSARVSWIELFPALTRWWEGDYLQSLKEIEANATRLHSLDERARGRLGETCTFLYLALGKLESVRQIAEQLPLRNRVQALANLALFTDEYSLLDTLANYADETMARDNVVISLARAGHVEKAAALLSHFSERWGQSISPRTRARLGIAEAEVARARGDVTRAMELLQESIGVCEGIPTIDQTPSWYFGSESLAELLEQRGAGEEALSVLEAACRPEGGKVYPTGPFPWIKNQWLLAKLYRRLGRDQQAEEIEANLLEMLILADANHPILLDLQRRTQLTSN